MNYPVYNPYQQQYQPMYQQPAPQFNPVQNQPGSKIVENEEAVRYQEIPVDGKTYYFVKADGSEIYSKKWLPNCTTEVKTFRAIEETVEDNQINPSISKEEIDNLQEIILSKLNEFDDRFSKLEKAIANKAPARKEANNG